MILVSTVLCGGVAMLSCSESPTSNIDLPPLLPLRLSMQDTTITCDFGHEWYAVNGHVEPDSSDFHQPTNCWEYDDEDIIHVSVTWWIEHDLLARNQWRVYGIDHDCQPGDTEWLQNAPHDTLYDSTFVGMVSRSTGFDVQFPSAAECALVGLWHMPGGGGELNMYLYLFTKLDSPSNLDGAFDGEAVDLAWSNAESVITRIERRQHPGTWGEPIDSVDADSSIYSDIAWSFDRTYKYRVRHTSQPAGFSRVRLSDPSSEVEVVIPDSLRTIIVGPDTVKAGDECAWVASPTGGKPAYSYEWSGLAEGNGAILLESFDLTDSGEWLHLNVSDEYGWTAQDSIQIFVVKFWTACERKR